MTRRFALVYSAVFIPFGIYVVYFQVLLRARGLSQQMIGLTQGILAIVSILAPPIWGYLSDKTDRPRMALALAVGGSVPAFLLFGYVSSYYAVLITAIIFASLYRPIIPLITGLTFRFIKQQGGNYGLVRVFGSVAFVIPVGILELIDISRPDSVTLILYGFAAMGIINLAAVFLLPKDSKIKLPEAKDPDITLFLNKKILTFVTASFLSRMAMVSYYFYFTLYLKDKIGFAQAGWLWIIGPLSEVPVILCSGWLIDKIGVRRLFALSLFGVAARLFGMGIADAVWQIALLQFLHALTFGAYHVAGVTYLSQLVPDNMQSSVQTFHSAFSSGLAGICGGVLGGYILQNFGYSWMYGIFSGVALVGMVLFLGVGRGED